MRNLKLRSFALLLTVFALVAAACSDEPEGEPSASGATGTASESPAAEQDLLARIQADGVIRVATDQKYKPQSWYDTKAEEWKGFDVEVAQEVASRLGVDGGDRPPGVGPRHGGIVERPVGHERRVDDGHEGAMPRSSPSRRPTTTRPASIAVHSDNTSVQDLTTDLDGKKVCVGSSTTYESFLEQQLNIPGYTFDYVIDDPQIITYATDTDALDNLALGDGARCDAAMTALPTIDQYIADGGPVKVVGDPLYGEPLSIAFDSASPIDNASLVAAVSAIIDEMHADGTLTELSMKWYGEDITQV